MEEETTITEAVTLPVDFSSNFSVLLQLNPPDFSRSYGLLILFTIGEVESSIHYEVMVTYVKTIPEQARIFKIERLSPVYVDDSLPQTMIDRLAADAGEALYPLCVEVDFDGKFLRVHNQEEILSRWPACKEKLMDYYQGELTEKYLALMEETLVDADQLNSCFRRDLFISTYFSAIYKSYTHEHQIEETLYFPLAGHTAGVEFSTTQRVDPLLNHYGAIEIDHSGVASDERSLEDLESECDFPLSRMEKPEIEAIKGDYTAKYVLDAATRSIELIVASWNLPGMRIGSTELRMFRLDPEQAQREEQQKKQLERVEEQVAATGLVYLDGEGSDRVRPRISELFGSIFKKQKR